MGNLTQLYLIIQFPVGLETHLVFLAEEVIHSTAAKYRAGEAVRGRLN